ncbi:hypothetical protein GAP32_501 [Cronobacter phage vB_CsaM_GAP32]|uniref:Putative membrane protein n=1 Tax=Cronobacter phage vB_CsaM_GAP32 TaxID=1141136 RepID=K4F9R3_9CAUD|nr:hypothetical protein GAP32_501 [Cronobacter phage vB_CsaM_GAP32]AFC21960.1 putative membrane protein [Cronobacter phage vB_CsaM_GAP32]
MTATQRQDLCFFGGLAIAVLILLIGAVLTVLYNKEWILPVTGIIAIALSFLYIELILKFVKVKLK